jgi:cytosine/adenosine deaminase-related metal-dependent hydrolase
MRLLTADWVLPVSSPPIKNGAVVIDGENIIAVGDKEDLAREFPAAAAEDFGAAAIIPGLINCHSHLELTGMRGLLDDVEHDFLAWLLRLTKVRNDSITAEDVELSALLGVIEGARAGVTCFADVGRSGVAAIRALKQVGLRGIVYQETDFFPHDDLARQDLETLKEKFFSVKEHEDALREAAISPHSPYTVSTGLFRELVKFCGAENIKTSIHCAESQMEEDFVRRGTGLMAGFWQKSEANWQIPGVSSVSYLSSLGVLEIRPLLVHCVNADGLDLELIATAKASIAHCPKSNAKFGHGVAPLEMMLREDVTVGMGSDSVASNNSCDIIEEARFASLIARTRLGKKRLVPAAEMLEMMTLGGAKALRLDDRVGSLEAGKQADLAVISFDNAALMPVFDPAVAIVFAAGGRDVVRTIVAGRDIYRDNVVLTVDENSIKQNMTELVSRITAQTFEETRS